VAVIIKGTAVIIIEGDISFAVVIVGIIIGIWVIAITGKVWFSVVDFWFGVWVVPSAMLRFNSKLCLKD